MTKPTLDSLEALAVKNQRSTKVKDIWCTVGLIVAMFIMGAYCFLYIFFGRGN